MSRRRETMPAFAHEMLVKVANALRGAKAKAEARGVEHFPLAICVDSRNAVALGTMYGIAEGAAIDIEALLATYPPPKARTIEALLATYPPPKARTA